jgi:hypothetical protein
MVSRFVMVSLIVIPGRLFVVMRGLLMMVGGIGVVLRCFLWPGLTPSYGATECAPRRLCEGNVDGRLHLHRLGMNTRCHEQLDWDMLSAFTNLKRCDLVQIDPILALGVTLSTAATDAVYVMFSASVAARKRVPAATWSSVWYLLSAFAVISYTRNWMYVGFAALGSWIGAYLSMTWLRRPEGEHRY